MKSILILCSCLAVSFGFSQNLPFINPANIHGTAEMCVYGSSTPFTNLGITDIDLDSVSIISVESSNSAVIDPSNVSWNYANTTPDGTSYFSISTFAASAGTAILTLEVSDQVDTVMLTLPVITAITPTTPTWTTSLIELCSNQGMVDLSTYLVGGGQGGSFYDNGMEMTFDNGLFNTNDSPYTPEEVRELSFESYGTCYLNSQVDIVFHESPTVNTTQTSTLCNQSTGTATALISGGATPYGMMIWSSGQQNTTSATNLAAGQYSFSVTDANSCTVSKYFTINTSGITATAAVQNANCFGSATGGISLAPSGMLAPVSALWSSGHSSLNLSGVPAGNYTVQLTDAAGCILTRTYTITQPEELIAESYVNIYPTCGVSDGELSADAYGGVSPYTYAWSNGDAGQVTSATLPWGIYSLTATDANGCIAVKTTYLSEDGSAEISGDVTGANCGTSEASIDVTPYYIPFGNTVSSISWSNGAQTEDIFNVPPALYICTLVISSNCTTIKGWDIPVVKPLQNPICVVTVDDSTTTNLVVWERTQPTGIAYYNIYRETSVQGNYALIDTVHADGITLFNDVVASPLSRAWRYKISAVNACGVEGPLSAPHQTIHLDVLDNSGTSVTINWNAYEGTAFSSYFISRYTTANGWEEIAEVPATQLSYTDGTAFSTPGLDYMVEMQLDEYCTALVYRTSDFNSSRSNKDKGNFLPGHGTGDSDNGLDEAYLSSVTIYPNPATATVTIKQESSEELMIEIRSVEGQLIKAVTTTQLSETIDISSLADGIYFITTGLNNSTQITRIIKQ